MTLSCWELTIRSNSSIPLDDVSAKELQSAGRGSWLVDMGTKLCIPYVEGAIEESSFPCVSENKPGFRKLEDENIGFSVFLACVPADASRVEISISANFGSEVFVNDFSGSDMMTFLSWNEVCECANISTNNEE